MLSSDFRSIDHTLGCRCNKSASQRSKGKWKWSGSSISHRELNLVIMKGSQRYVNDGVQLADLKCYGLCMILSGPYLLISKFHKAG